MRASVLDTLSADHVRTARAKGLSNARILAHHVVRNAFTPVLTVLGLHMGALLGGTVLVEYVFNWPGLSTPLIRAANNGDMDIVKLLLEKGADATLYTADRQTPIHAAILGRSAEAQVGEMIRLFQKAGTDVNVVALVNHPEEVRGGSALHYAVRKRQKETIKLLASLGINMDAVDQDGLTALDYTQSRGFMPFMALQTPLFKEEAALLRELGATKLLEKSPVWPVLGPPQGIWEDIYPLGESTVHAPVYRHD